MKRLSAAFILFLLVSFIALEPRISGAEYKYQSRGKRDPFIPLVTGEVKRTLGLESVETIDDVIFEGIIFDPSGESMAVLNSEILKEGDKISNIEVTKISNNSVTLKIYDKSYTINLIEEGGETVER